MGHTHCFGLSRRSEKGAERKMKRSLVVGSFSLALGVMGCLDLGTTNGPSGGSGGSSGGGAGSLIQEWQATEPTSDTSVNGYTLPPWLHIECITSERTSQWGPNLIKRPFAADAARPRNVGNGWGLSLESQRKNQILNSDAWDGPTWISSAPVPAMAKTTGNADPSGGNAATKFVAGLAQRSDKATIPIGYASAWFRGEDPAGTYAHFVVSIGDTGWRFQTLTGISDWSRVSLGTGSGEYFLDTVGNGPSNAPPITASGTIYAHAAQHETDNGNNVVYYPSSYIPNTDKVRLRYADRLYTDSAAELIPSGYFHVVMKVAPNYASGEATENFHYLLYINGTNQLRIELDEGKIALESGGNSLTGPGSGSVVWSRDQEITVEVNVTPKGRTLTVSGATSGNFTVSDAEDRPWPADNRIFILGTSGGAQECADLRYIGFFTPN